LTTAKPGLSIAIILLSLAAPAQTVPISGRWRSITTSKGGIGAMFEFHADGSVDYSPGAVVEGNYRIEGDQLIVPPATVNGPEQKYTIEWPANTSVRLRAGADSVMELHRQGPEKDAARPLLGEWTGTRDMGGKSLTVHWLFYADGKQLFLLPFLTQQGRYTAKADSLHLELPGRPPVDGKFQVDGDILTVPGPNNGTDKFKRY
jgi:hypothetical protein